MTAARHVPKEKGTPEEHPSLFTRRLPSREPPPTMTRKMTNHNGPPTQPRPSRRFSPISPLPTTLSLTLHPTRM